MATTYTNLGPIYLTQEKFNTLLETDALEVGREYKIIDWEAQEKLIAGNNITIADDGKTISVVSPDLSEYAKTVDVNTAVATAVNNLVDGAPEALNTLKELADNFSGVATESWVENKNYLTEHQSLDDYATQAWVNENKMPWLGDKGNVPEWKTDDPGAGYAFHIPYRFEFTPDANKLDIKMYTITADGNNTFDEWDNTLPPANSIEALSYQNAGLMTSADATAVRTTIPNAIANMATQSWVEEKGYITDISSKQDTLIAGDNITIAEDGKTISAVSPDLSGYVDTSNNQDIYGDKTFHSPIAYGTGLNATFLDDKKIRTTGAMSPERIYNLPQDDDLEVTLASQAWVEGKGYLTEHQTIRTINGNSLTDTSDDLAIKTYQAFPSDFVTDSTLDALISSIESSSGCGAGMAYLGDISGACTPWGFGNAECKVEYMTDDIALITVSSSNISPYIWVMNTWEGTWRGLQGVLTAGTGITIDENNTISASGTTDISGKVDKTTTEKESVYTGDSSAQYNRLLVNDITSQPEEATDEMIPTAKAVVNAITAKAIPNASATEIGGLKLYYDSANKVLYLTNDGSDPTPSTT